MQQSDPMLAQAVGDYARQLQARGERHIRLSRAAKAGLETLLNTLKPVVAPVSTTARPTSAPARNEPVAATPKRSELPMVRPAVPLTEAIRVEGNTKAEKLESLRKQVEVCRKCEHLASSRTQTVFGVGNPEAELMFVGEAPGADEDKQGEPFVGLAGQLLTKMIVAMGLSREQVYIANILKCRPDMPKGSSGNRKPTSEEMKTCLPYVCTQIDIIAPKAIVALGSTAVEGIFGGMCKITAMRGKFLEFRGIPVMPTFHPAYLLRNQSILEKRKVWEDLLQTMEKLGLQISEKQRGFFLNK